MLRARAILGEIARVVHPASGAFDLSGCENLVDAVIGIITRHPMSEGELKESLQRWPTEEVLAVLADLESSGRAQMVERYGSRFWSAAPSIYPGDAASVRTKPRPEV